MVESGGRLRLPLEAGQGLGVFGNVIGQKLQGDKPVQGYVLGLVHDPHSAATQLFNDAVMGNDLSDHEEECYGGSVGKSMKAVELAVSQKGLVTQNRDYTSIPN
jgi:hypothetical protein